MMGSTVRWWFHAWTNLSLIVIVTLRGSHEKELPLRRANVVFLVDRSNSIWEKDFKRELRFVQETVTRFEIGGNFTRVAVITYSKRPTLIFGLDVFNDTQSIVEATLLTPALKATCDLFGTVDLESCQGNGLRRHHPPSPLASAARSLDVNGRHKKETSVSADQLNGEAADIDSPINVLVLMGDGELDDLGESHEMARCLSSQRVHLFSVGVGRSQIKRIVDSFAAVPHLYRISIDSYDPPSHPSDAMAGSKSSPIWELMLKYRAMAEDCIPHKKKIVLNFIFDIVSKKSWRYPTFVRMAEDMYLRLRRRLTTKRKRDYVRMRFYPKNFERNATTTTATRQPESGPAWSRMEAAPSERFKEMLEEGRIRRRMKKLSSGSNVTSVGEKTTRRKSYELINSLLAKIQHADKQQVVIYMTDREIEPITNVEEISRVVRRNLRNGVKLEMFAIAVGSLVDESRLSSLLRHYHSNPMSRLFVFKTKLKGYSEAMENFTKLFCSPL